MEETNEAKEDKVRHPTEDDKLDILIFDSRQFLSNLCSALEQGRFDWNDPGRFHNRRLAPLRKNIQEMEYEPEDAEDIEVR